MNGGLSFRKGCYVGQEVVSRMQHRGTARRRLVIVAGEGRCRRAEPTFGQRTADRFSRHRTGSGRPGYRRGSTKAGEAIAKGEAILAGDVRLTLTLPRLDGTRLSERGRRGERMMSARAWPAYAFRAAARSSRPSPLDVELSDIAHGLARVARWNGADFRRPRLLRCPAQSRCRGDFPPHQSLRCPGLPDGPASRRAGIRHRRHDLAVQGVVGGGYKTVEKRLENAVHLRFGLPAHTPGNSRSGSRRPTVSRLFRSDGTCRLFRRGGPKVLRSAARHHPRDVADRPSARGRGAAALRPRASMRWSPNAPRETGA